MTQPRAQEQPRVQEQPSAQDRLAALRAAYPTPEAVTSGMQRELDAFEQTMRGAAAHWGTRMPGRDWTPAQEAEHTILVNEGTGKVVRLLLSGRPLRDTPQFPGQIRDGRWLAPPGTEPGPEQPLEALLARHAATCPLLAGVQAGPDPERTFPHPFLGNIDALDWLRMAAGQTGHHRRTLQAGLDRLDAGERATQ
jgi:hypothetical protein